MKFNADTYVSGAPTLVGHTRFLAGDPSAATSGSGNYPSNNLWHDDEVKDAINLAYEELWLAAKKLDFGWGRKLGYATSVTNQLLYDLPTDIDGAIIDIAIETSGKDLSSDSTAVWTYLEPSEENIAERLYRTGELTTPKYVYIKGGTATPQKYGIAAPPSTGGSSSIAINYEAQLTHLSLDADEPLAPEAHHPLICYMAAITLKTAKDLPVDGLRAEAARKYPQFLEAMSEPIYDLEGQMVAVGRVAQKFYTKAGRVQRSS